MQKKNSLRIKIEKDPYGFGEGLFQESYITLKPGLNMLVGCNGAGKSTILRGIKKICKERHIPCFINDSRQRSTRNMVQSALFSGAPDAPNFMLAQLEASEGEFQMYGLANRVAGEIGQFVLYDNKNHKGDIVILLDAIDSGLSIDMIQDLKNDLFGTILNEELKPNPDMTIYLVVAANTFTMIKDERSIDVQTGKEVFFSNYDDFEAFILNSRNVRHEIETKRTDRGENAYEDEEDEDMLNEEDYEDEEDEETEDPQTTLNELYGINTRLDGLLDRLKIEPGMIDLSTFTNMQ